MKQAIVVFNSGSTSLKFGVYMVDSARDSAAALSLLRMGRIASMHGDPRFAVKDGADKSLDSHEWGEGHAIDNAAATKFVIGWLEAHLGGIRIIAAGHLIVLGGTRFEAPGVRAPLPPLPSKLSGVTHHAVSASGEILPQVRRRHPCAALLQPAWWRLCPRR
jgi:acetate kinase